MSSPKHIAIVGGGFSGTMTAVHILKVGKSPLTIYLVERDARQLGGGVAYGRAEPCHLLNVPAGNMSAFPEVPDHFLRWASTHRSRLIDPLWVTEISAAAFLPRRAYGAYLRELLDDAERSAGPGLRLERVSADAVGITLESEAVVLRFRDGGALHADRAVLALGNFRPGNPAVTDPTFYASPRYHADPWTFDVLPAMLETRSCLLIGSGLTMVDWALTLSQAGYRGEINVISRRGLWPQAHAKVPRVDFGLDTISAHGAIRPLVRQIRQYLQVNGCDWRAVIDALRPNTQEIWGSLSATERRRFLRHLRPYWDSHRHRIAPIVAERMNDLIDSEQLRRHVGHIRNFRHRDDGIDVEVRLRGRAATSILRVEAVLNCSGSESDYRNLDSPLVRDLLDQGLGRPDPLRLGLDVAGDGRLIDRHGQVSHRLFTLGPPQKGTLWETTAVPEIRVQAARLATALVEPTVNRVPV
jgi:uncharacterized NAD(P)/FAD-binding protein YdhS